MSDKFSGTSSKEFASEEVQLMPKRFRRPYALFTYFVPVGMNSLYLFYSFYSLILLFLISDYYICYNFFLFVQIQ